MRQIKVGDKILYKLHNVYHVYTIRKINRYPIDRYPIEYWVLEEYGYFSGQLEHDIHATLLEI